MSVIFIYIMIYIFHYVILLLLINRDGNKQSIIIQRSLKDVYEEFPHQKDNIKELIQFESDGLLVFIDSENDLDWETKDRFDELGESEVVQSVLADIDFVQHQAGVRYLSKKTKRDLVWYLGRAVCLAFHEDEIKAKEVMLEAKHFLYNRKAEITRRWQLMFALSIYLLSLMIYVASRFINICDQEWFVILESCIIYGFTGVLLSFVHRVGLLDYDCSSGRCLNIMQVLSRYVAGGIGAVFIVNLYQSDLIFDVFHNVEKQDAVLFILSIIGGFSERLAPSVIEKFAMEEITK
ncbi:hypothetical protein SELR_17220 [Selenomonas ruminantium subsp. lactilytica TAM6421]|uniref:Uncharacterized protein n=1 Tax=Selenomonas ruminantium subsp. lactilytica (strain NBRC 103574 / TAM6421) TaxID=927704 RepID=I0GRP3_SELRL|nr:hypothetical protein [Selenomonas ruminantium]BAL83430.1 hypothetical protein SELR_17220 [Selenomonas ruminantium subsp. lactilytica TAM6421]